MRTPASKPAVEPWYLGAAVLPILTAIRANPPKCVRQECFYGDRREEWWTFIGEDVNALVKIHGEIAFELLAKGDASGDYSEWRAFHEAGTVEDVICAATGTHLPGTLLITDTERRAEIAATIDAAFAGERNRERRAA